MSSMWEYTFVGRGQLKNGVKGMGTYILIEKTSTPTNGFMQGSFTAFGQSFQMRSDLFPYSNSQSCRVFLPLLGTTCLLKVMQT